MGRIICQICWTASLAANVTELRVSSAAAAATRTVVICRTCAKAIAPSLITWLARRQGGAPRSLPHRDEQIRALWEFLREGQGRGQS
jgi:hypothetical protein